MNLKYKLNDIYKRISGETLLRDVSRSIANSCEFIDFDFRTYITKIEIKRGFKKLQVNIFTPSPGRVIGPNGINIEFIKKNLQDDFFDYKVDTEIKDYPTFWTKMNIMTNRELNSIL